MSDPKPVRPITNPPPLPNAGEDGSSSEPVETPGRERSSESIERPGDNTPDRPDPTRFGDWERNGKCIDF